MIEPDNAFWKRKQAKNLKRKVNLRKPRDTFLIVCEGEKTEPNYFKSFKLKSAYFKDVFGIGDNTEQLVQRAIKFRNDARKYGVKYDQVWCVFDKDSFPAENFNKAIVLAKKENIRIAYSNEAFELWYLLHFDYVCTAIARTQCIVNLSARLGGKYEKNSEEMYSKLYAKQAQAIQNAKNLLASYPNHIPHQNNPSTTVHLLVEELNQFLSD